MENKTCEFCNDTGKVTVDGVNHVGEHQQYEENCECTLGEE